METTPAPILAMIVRIVCGGQTTLAVKRKRLIKRLISAIISIRLKNLSVIGHASQPSQKLVALLRIYEPVLSLAELFFSAALT